MKKLLTVVALVFLSAPGEPLEGYEFRWLAFGDSITRGDYDTGVGGGYPTRLTSMFGCAPGICEVFNAGKSGEKTYQAVTRIRTVLAEDGPFDVMTLMEGTNDIFREYPLESTLANLNYIAYQARLRGTDTVMASIIWYHPDGEHGRTKDDEVETLRDGVEDLTIQYSRYFVDIWDVLCPDSHPDVHGHGQTQCFNRHYSDVPNGDNRGHPIGSGYTMMANAFYNGLTSVPVPGAPVPVSPTGTVPDGRPTLVWERESPTRANWYRVVVESSSGVAVDRWIEGRIFCVDSNCSYRLSLAEELAAGDYTWRVQGRNPAGLGPPATEVPFSVRLDLIFLDGFESGDTRAWSKP